MTTTASAERILVTGGAGYVGAHTVHHLVKGGVDPSRIVVFDDLSMGHRDALPDGVALVEGDLRCRADVESAFAGRDVGSVVHFAGLAYVGESMRQPERYFGTNVAGGLVLLEAMRAHGCRRIVFSSTCSVYGVPDAVPIGEDHPQVPINPYGESKRMFERILAWYGPIHGIRSISLRYFNAAGAAYGIGERHEPETHAIPLLLDAALGKREPFTVLGVDHPTPDGSCIRDYIHVVDLARAHVQALERLRAPQAQAEVFNLGTGVGTSVLELIGMVEALLGRRIDYRRAPPRPGDPPVLVASFARARERLGWSPSLTMRDILADALAWHQR
jgi:UDP-glucose-4-epimerase GalE